MRGLMQDSPLTIDTIFRHVEQHHGDGTTTDDWRDHFYEHQGATCPAVDVPAVATGAVLVRCQHDTTSYALVLPDARRDGLWFLVADTRAHAAHPTSYVLTSLVDAVEAVYG